MEKRKKLRKSDKGYELNGANGNGSATQSTEPLDEANEVTIDREGNVIPVEPAVTEVQESQDGTSEHAAEGTEAEDVKKEDPFQVYAKKVDELYGNVRALGAITDLTIELEKNLNKVKDFVSNSATEVASIKQAYEAMLVEVGNLLREGKLYIEQTAPETLSALRAQLNSHVTDVLKQTEQRMGEKTDEQLQTHYEKAKKDLEQTTQDIDKKLQSAQTAYQQATEIREILNTLYGAGGTVQQQIGGSIDSIKDLLNKAKTERENAVKIADGLSPTVNSLKQELSNTTKKVQGLEDKFAESAFEASVKIAVEKTYGSKPVTEKEMEQYIPQIIAEVVKAVKGGK